MSKVAGSMSDEDAETVEGIGASVDAILASSQDALDYFNAGDGVGLFARMQWTRDLAAALSAKLPVDFQRFGKPHRRRVTKKIRSRQ